MDSYNSCKYLPRRFNKIHDCRINTTEPNQMILVSFFSEDNVFSNENKNIYIFEYQSNENWASCFLGDTRYEQVLTIN